MLEEIEEIIKTYSERFKLDEFEIEPDTNEDVKINENPISNNITNYSDESEDQIDTTEKNENIQLSEDIKNQLGSDLIYYSEYDNNPSFLDLKIKMDSETLTMEEKKFLLKFYNEKNKNKKVDNKYFPVSEDKFNGEENITYEKEQDEISNLQDEITQEQSEKANPTESEEKLLQMIDRSRGLLQTKMLFKEYKPDEHDTIVSKIEECNDLIDSKDIKNNITKTQYEYFKKLQDEI